MTQDGIDDGLQARQRAGALLREAREAAARSSGELASQLKVAREKIEALEAGDWTPLHSASYARALLRAAAKALKVDVEPLMRSLPPASEVLPQPVAVAASVAPVRPYRVWLAAAALLVVAALALVLLPRHAARRAAPHAVGPSSAPPLRAASRLQSPAAERTRAASAARPAAGPGTAPEAVKPALLAPASSGVGASTQPPGPLGLPSAMASAPLQLRANAPSWIEVRAADGQTVFRAILKPGVTQSVAAAPAQLPLQLTIGNAAHTRVLFRNRPVPLASSPNNVVHLQLP